jgi:putative PIN family toxin of toxin-antitoxin system
MIEAPSSDWCSPSSRFGWTPSTRRPQRRIRGAREGATGPREAKLPPRFGKVEISREHFREADAEPIVIGAHRRPEAVQARDRGGSRLSTRAALALIGVVRVVFDSNVLISARLEPRGPSASLLGAWIEQNIDMIVSPQLLDELQDVLGRERLRRRLTEEEANVFVDSIRSDATIVEYPPSEPGITAIPTMISW